MWFLSTSLAISLMAAPAPNSENFPPILEGHSEYGFTYYLMTTSEDNSEPVLSVDGSPLYEGIRDSLNKESFRVVQSYKNLIEGEFLSEFEGRAERLPILKKGIRFSFSKIDMARILNFFKTHPKEFRSYFSSPTEEKMSLLHSLISDEEMILTKEALASLQRSAFNPTPQPLVIPISVQDSSRYFQFLKPAWEALIEISVEELRLKFKEKQFIFNPETNTFNIRLILDKVLLKGPIKEIGRLRGIHAYTEKIPLIKNIKFDGFLYLEKGEVGDMVLDMTLKLIMPERGFWKIEAVEPLQFRALNIDPKVNLLIYNKEKASDDEEKILISEENVSLKGKTLEVIRQKIETAIESAFSIASFSRSMGFAIPLHPSENESLGGDIRFDAHLGGVNFSEFGLSLAFDSQIVLYRTPDCISKNNFDALSVNRQFKPIQSTKGNRWVLKSSYPKNPYWIVEGMESFDTKTHILDGASLEVSPAALEQANRLFYLSGLYCLSTRGWAKRPDSIPFVEVHPTELIPLEIKDNSIIYTFKTELHTFKRDGNYHGEKFVNTNKVPLEFSASFNFHPEKKSITFDAPLSLEFTNFSRDENLFIEKLKDLLLNSLLGEEVNSSWEVGYAELSKNKTYTIRELGLSSAGIKMAMDVDFEKLASRPRNKVKATTAGKPKTVLDSNLPIWVSDQFIEIKWDSPAPNMFYSYYLKSIDGESWKSWTYFKRGKKVSILLNKSGKYEFHIKAMNDNFEIEDVPVVHSFIYQGYEGDKLNEKSNIQWTMPEKAEIEKKDDPAIKVSRAGAKGLFGCSLRASGSGLSAFILLIFALGMLGVLRRQYQFHDNKINSSSVR